MSNAEIASTLGIREKTVENHMTRALKTLRRELARFRRGE
jgi:DNA-directed RNA polymerase specialized sigma24 family protein